MGAKGYTVENHTEIDAVIKDAVASKRPCVINAVIEGGKEVLADPFRRDALKQPKRYLPKYQHLVN